MKILLFFFVIAVALSCNKNKQFCGFATLECTDGFIFWGGDPAADGLGWYLSATRSAEKRFYIENPPAAFKIDSIAVNACLEETNKPIVCNCVGTKPNYYNITEIRKR